MSPFAAILLPDFPLQAVLRHEPELRDRPMALCEGKTIIHVTAAAFAQGVHAGLTSTQGLGRCSTLLIRGRSPSSEVSAANVLLQVCSTLSPWIEATAPGLCTAELRTRDEINHSRYSGIVEQLGLLGLHAQIGLGANPDLASLAARYARPIMEADARFLASLPVEALEPAEEILRVLRSWGIGSLGMLTALAPDQLIDRLGPEMRPLWERAAGCSRRLLKLVTPPEVFEETIEFEHEIEVLEPLLFMLRRFIEALSRRLESVYLVAAELGLELTFGDGSRHERRFAIPSPTRDVELLFRVVHTHLEQLSATAPVVALRLRAEPQRPTNQQFSLFENALRDPHRFFETLARLSSLVGRERVGVPALENTHRPDATRLEMPDPEKPAPVIPDRPHLGLPLRRYRPLIPAEVELHERRPVHLVSSEIRGAVIDWRGPWLGSGDWWDRNPWDLEEWDVQLPNRSLYRLRRTAAGWFLEGIYD